MRILLVEDHPAMRFAIGALLRSETDLAVVAETDNSGQALELARCETPDVAVVDLQLKGVVSGVELCRDLKSLPAPPRVLIYTAYNSTKHAQATFLSGADGFLHKGVAYEKLPEAIRACQAGERPWLLGVEGEEVDSSPRVVPGEEPLTATERVVLDLVYRGLTNPEISSELSVSLSTVKTHVGSILRKTGRKNRREL